MSLSKLAGTTLLSVAFTGALTAAAIAQNSNYKHVPNAAISGHNKAKVTGSIEDCKNACRNETRFICKSFDYNKGARSCDLSDKSMADVALKKDYPGNPYDYYGRDPNEWDSRASMAADAGEKPDLTTVWDSDFGPIYWLGGYYGDPSKTLTGKLDSSGRVFVGDWGRFDSQRGVEKSGFVKFEFSKDLKSFTGTYMGSDGTTKNWNGRYKAGAPYSLGQTQPSNHQGSQYNAQLAYQVNAAASAAGQQYENYGETVETTSRCDTDMIGFFKSQGLRNTSIRQLCRP